MSDKDLVVNSLSEQMQQANILSEEIRPQLIACEKFTTGLNSPPPSGMIKDRQGIKYLPISSVESELDRMFTGLWKTTNLEWKVVINEIVVSLELHVFHPIAKIWISRCGVGVAQIRQKSGSKIQDIDAKIKNALEMDVPHAKADAIKNAAKSLGKHFGRDLSRKAADVATFQPVLLTKIQQLKKTENEA